MKNIMIFILYFSVIMFASSSHLSRCPPVPAIWAVLAPDGEFLAFVVYQQQRVLQLLKYGVYHK